MLNLGEIDGLERQLKASIVALNKKKIVDLTLIEAIDDAMLWPDGFDDMVPLAPTQNLESLMSRTPLLVCAIASEIGFRFEGVGTVFWAKFSEALGLPVTITQRQRLAEIFEAQSTRFGLSHPSESAFSNHFSIIAWPISNAQLPVDLVGPVSRLMARAPVAALPGPARAINFSSLRAWAASAEGARLTDWLRFEAPATRVLTALLNDNRGGILSQANFTRLRDAISIDPEAFFAARVARLRGRAAKPSMAPAQTFGRLSLMLGPNGISLFANWPALPAVIYDEARDIARSSGWKPQLWGAGSFLHPDTALSAGPFAIAVRSAPTEEQPVYPDAATIFGAGSDISAMLASRMIDWTSTLLFDVNDERSQAEQRFGLLEGSSGYAWIGRKQGVSGLDGLKILGAVGGYRFFEANLSDSVDREILTGDELLSTKQRSLLSRHPVDAICAPNGIVRPDRPFLLYGDGSNDAENVLPQKLAANGRISTTLGSSAQSVLRAEPAPPPEVGGADLVLFERDSAFEALIERRVQVRVESRLPLVNVELSADLEIDGSLIARGRVRLAALPMTVPSTSPLLAPLYDDSVRTKLLEAGRGMLRLSVGRSQAIVIPLQRPLSSVEWHEDGPQLVGANLDVTLVEATARAPHRFTPTTDIITPKRGAKAYGLLLSDGRIADPLRIVSSSVFDYGDFTAQFTEDTGSRRMFDHGRGIGDIARARIAWARAQCITLAAVGAKGRILRQFEEPMVFDLCGRSWALAEESCRDTPTDPHESLWDVALERGLATVPVGATATEISVFGSAFVRHAKLLDPSWPIASRLPADGVMDDALNAGFSEAIVKLHDLGALLTIEDDFDFGSPNEEWEAAATKALRAIRRPALVRQIAPTEGGHLLARRTYADLSIAELAEDLAAWTKTYALPRGQLSAENAAGALHLWLSPAACDDVDATVHILANDPFVSRATRYAALRASLTITRPLS
jgi:hypothetical protein